MIEQEAWDDLYTVSAPEARASSKAAFISNAQQVARVTGDISEVTIEEAHFFEPGEVARESPNGFFHSPLVPSYVFRGSVRLGVPTPKRHVVVLAETKSELEQPLWLTLLCAESAEGWQVVAWHFNPRRSNDHDGYWYADRASRFDAVGQRRNAHLYRVLAFQLLVLSPYLVSEDAVTLNRALTTDVPSNLPFPMVRPAEIWPITDSESVEVHTVMPVAIGVAFADEVRFQSKIADLESESARRQRKRVADYVMRVFPEYRDGFDGIYVETTLTTGKSYRDYFAFE